MSELSRLKIKRGHLKAQVTRTSNYVANLDLDTLDESQVIQLKCRLDTLGSVLTEFNETQFEIEYAITIQNGSVAEEAKESNEFECRYFELVCMIKKALDKFSKVQSGIDVNIKDDQKFNEGFKAVMLPTIKLPTFNGRFDKWLEFRDAFVALVHDRQSISPIEKFYHLKNFLEGEPLQLISSIEVSAANYTVAWVCLKERYENKKLIIHNYVKTMFQFQPLEEESCLELRRLYDTFSNSIQSLKTLGQPTDRWDTLLLYLVTSKFDYTTQRDWENCCAGKDLATWDDVSKFLKIKCELLEKLESNKNDLRNAEPNPNNSFSRKPMERIRTLMSSTIACYYCKQPHSVYKCETFLNLDIKSRIDQVRMLKLCENCFDPNHTASQCRFRGTCRICNKKHNTLIHLPDALESETPNTQLLEEDSNWKSSDNNVIISSHALRSDSYSGTLLSTALIQVYDNLGRSHLARALLDPGSQGNFITDRLLSELNLKKTPVNMSIVGIGDMSSVPIKLQTRVKLSSIINNFEQDIDCSAVHKITQRVPTCSIDVGRWPIPEDIKLKLADPNFNIAGEVDILLGVGIFYNLLLKNQITLPNMPTLQETKLGWIFGGSYSSDNLRRNRNNSISCMTANIARDARDEHITRFGKLVDCNEAERSPTREARFFEHHFVNNVKGNCDGRFIGKIPFKNKRNEPGKSKEGAIKRFYYLERKLKRNTVMNRDRTLWKSC